MPVKLSQYGYDLQYGKDSDAPEQSVWFRVTNEGKQLLSIYLPAEEFMQVAAAFATVARAVEADLYGADQV